MSELHTFNLDDLLIEVEEFRDFYDGTHYRDYSITIKAKGFDLHRANMQYSGLDPEVKIDIAARHTVTAEEMFWERADYECDRGRDGR